MTGEEELSLDETAIENETLPEVIEEVAESKSDFEGVKITVDETIVKENQEEEIQEAFIPLEKPQELVRVEIESPSRQGRLKFSFS